MKRILFITTALFFSACFGTKNFTHSNSVRQPYVEFFIDTGVNQYFIKPLKFTSEDKKSNFYIDFTFRDTLKNSSLTIVNFSFFSDKLTKSIDSVIIIYNENNEKNRLTLCKKLFLKKNKKKYELRYTCSLTYKKTLMFFYNEPEIILIAEGKKIKFHPTKKTVKNIKIIKENIIELIKTN